VKRLYIHESIYNEFRAALVEFVKSLKVGDGLERGVVLGPIQNSMQYDRVQGFFDDVEKENMKIAIGGRTANSEGYFINPTIIDNPRDDSKIVTEEPFGKFTIGGRGMHADGLNQDQSSPSSLGRMKKR
jgi:acyl-CoA reductase-like NAD-dependent aldehyde dehydrogenase